MPKSAVFREGARCYARDPLETRAHPSFDRSRRRFLRWSAAGAFAVTMGWRLIRDAEGPALPGLERLTENEGRILAAVYATITAVTDQARIQDAVHRMDAFLGHLGRWDRLELRAALQLVEQSPLVFHGLAPRFTSLSLENRARCLEGFRNGARWRKPVFSGLKELCYLVHYTDPASWDEIGYSGPLVPRAPRARLDRYEALLAKGPPA